MSDLTAEPPPPNRRRTSPPVDDKAPEKGAPNAVDLLGKLTSQGAHLAQEQVSLMQAEVREAANDVKAAVGAMAGAAVVGVAGLGVTLMGLAYLLGDEIDNLGLGTLIVGAVTLLVAAVMFSAGKKKADSAHLKPERTIRTLEATSDAATGHLNPAGGSHDR